MVKASGHRDGGDRENTMRASAEAAALLVRASHTAPDDLNRWLEADPAHTPAYIRTLSVWNDLGEVMAREGLTDVSSLDRSVRAAAGSFTPVAARRRPAGRLAALSAFACIALVCLFSVLWLMRPPTFATEIGEQRIVVLKDGTRVTLNTDTEIAIDDSERQRHVTLRRGEAFFEVAHDPAHPFVVAAHGARVQALGTSFTVRNDGNRLDVVLLTGVVRIDESGRIAPVTLQPGDRFSQGKGGAVRRDRPKIEAVTAWRNGELVLDATPLSEAVAEMNRYSERPIVLRDARAGAMRLSGVFRTRDNDTFANTVAAIYGLRVSSDDDALYIASRP